MSVDTMRSVAPRSLHPIHPTKIEAAEYTDGSVMLLACCACGGNLGPAIDLPPDHRPKDRIRAWNRCYRQVVRHEIEVGIRDPDGA